MTERLSVTKLPWPWRTFLTPGVAIWTLKFNNLEPWMFRIIYRRFCVKLFIQLWDSLSYDRVIQNYVQTKLLHFLILKLTNLSQLWWLITFLCNLVQAYCFQNNICITYLYQNPLKKMVNHDKPKWPIFRVTKGGTKSI